MPSAPMAVARAVALAAVVRLARADQPGGGRSAVREFLEVDDECSADGGACTLSALQVRSAARHVQPAGAEARGDGAGADGGASGAGESGESGAPAADGSASAGADAAAPGSGEPAAARARAPPPLALHVEMLGCQGDWCATVNAFNALFDTNDPAKMQQAIDIHGHWPGPDSGTMVGVTKDHYYMMYHGNVKAKLAEYLPQGMFSWSYGNTYKVFQHPSASNGGKLFLVRKGKITFNLGYFKRSMFWNMVVKPTPGWSFPYSQVVDFGDCEKCESEMVYILKKGGLAGQGDQWKIVGLDVVKLA